jgi:hypothetical protein
MTKNKTVRRGLAVACAGLGLLAIGAANPAFAQSAAPAAAAANGGAVAGCAPGSAQQSFTDRFGSTYKNYLEWNGDPADAPPTQREGYAPAPESSAPMPFTAWPIGGTEVIGYDNQYYGALMDALYCGSDGQAWKDSRVTIYGWANAGFNRSTSHTTYNTSNGTGGNFPAAYAYQPNTAQIDQVALYLERTPDVVQKEHFDWGFRLAGVWGTDTKYTFSRGLWSNQFSNGNGKVKKYGYDIPMAYVEGYFPNVADGMILRVGRYISVPDIEAQLAPNNYTYSHSLLYTYDPYTQEGAMATIRLNKNWTIQGGVSLGNDVAGWYKRSVPATYVNAAGNEVANPNAGQEYGSQLTGTACVQWTSDSGNDAIYPCVNGINRGNYGWNNVQQSVVSWYH